MVSSLMSNKLSPGYRLGTCPGCSWGRAWKHLKVMVMKKWEAGLQVCQQVILKSLQLSTGDLGTPQNHTRDLQGMDGVL